MIVVDSSVWIDFFADRSTAQVDRLQNVIKARRIVVGDIILLELLQGARDNVHAAAIELRMKAFLLERFLNTDLAKKAAENFRSLRSKGVTIRRTPDLVIGTYCIERGLPLLHNDRDFDHMAEHLGLQLA